MPTETHNPDRFHILFVCTANICRSAYAEFHSRSVAPGVRFSSAGTHALVGSPMDPVMARLLPEAVDPSDHRGRQLTRQVAEEADLIIALSAEHRRYILDEWPRLAKRTFLVGHAARELAAAPSDLPAAEIAGYLARHRTARAEDSVNDPYGLGADVARASAAEINRHLDPLLNLLVAPSETS